MNTKTSSVTTSPARALRSSLRLSVPAAVLGASLFAAPAMADLPEAWETPAEPEFFEFFMLVVGWPVLAALVLSVASFVFYTAKGRKFKAAGLGIEGEWAGGQITALPHNVDASASTGGASASH